jgi:ATP-dependent DNA helicase RecG
VVLILCVSLCSSKQYFSAISNEASLKGLQCGWLVFGVCNKTRKIVGTDYRDTRGLETLKHEIAQNTTGGITFIDIFEVYEKCSKYNRNDYFQCLTISS